MFKVIIAVSALIIIFAMIKTHHVVKALLFSVVHGLTALFAVNLIGNFIDVHIPINFFSLSVLAAGGIPGAVFLLISEILVLFMG